MLRHFIRHKHSVAPNKIIKKTFKLLGLKTLLSIFSVLNNVELIHFINTVCKDNFSTLLTFFKVKHGQ